MTTSVQDRVSQHNTRLARPSLIMWSLGYVKLLMSFTFVLNLRSTRLRIFGQLPNPRQGFAATVIFLEPDFDMYHRQKLIITLKAGE